MGMHHELLEFLEAKYRGGESALNTLAFHALKAEDNMKALHYAQEAGKRALAGNANDEAARHFGVAMQVLEKINSDDVECKKEVTAFMGDALFALRNYGDAVSYYKKALDLARMPIPRDDLANIVRKMAAWQYINWKMGSMKFPSKGRKTAKSKLILWTVKVLEKLCQSGMLDGDAMLSGFCAFRLVEYCDVSAKEGSLAVVGYALGSYLSLVLHKPELAERYKDMTISIVDTCKWIPELDAALAKMMYGMYCASFGRWEEAIAALTMSKELFKKYGERKSWRE